MRQSSRLRGRLQIVNAGIGALRLLGFANSLEGKMKAAIVMVLLECNRLTCPCSYSEEL